MNERGQNAQAWHREPLVWLVIAFPLAAVVGGLWTAWLAVSSADGLVVDDYYRQGLQINQDLSREARATALGLELAARLDGDGLEVRITGNSQTELPAQVRVSLRHATRGALDRSSLVAAGADGRFHLPVPGLAPGHWYVHVEAADWRLLQSLQVR